MIKSIRAENVWQNSIDIVLAWIPAHVGIPGNDRADELAKQATGHADIDVDCRLGPSEISSMILDSIKDEIDKKWTQLNHHSKEFIPTIRHSKIPISGIFKKRNRLILNKPRCMLTRGPRCDDCLADLTVNHLLLDCKRFDEGRKELKEIYSAKGLEFNKSNILAIRPKNNTLWSNLKFINSIDII